MAGAAGTGNLATAGVAGSTDTAPPLDRTVAGNFSDAFTFIFDGPNATQLGVTAGTIEPRRMAIVRGRVLDSAAVPVAQVTVASPEHPEYGRTLTRADGTFDFVVNGGGARPVDRRNGSSRSKASLRV